MSELTSAVCSITPTQRRRFFWAAWWTGAPSHSPFRKPDAAHGGARSAEEALAQAERAAGRHLVVIEPYWARAWTRVLRGEAPPPLPKVPSADSAKPARAQVGAPSAWSLLGLEPGASLADVKRAFRERALVAHPDQGGEPEHFRSLLRAYEKLSAKTAKRRP